MANKERGQDATVKRVLDARLTIEDAAAERCLREHGLGVGVACGTCTQVVAETYLDLYGDPWEA